MGEASGRPEQMLLSYERELPPVPSPPWAGRVAAVAAYGRRRIIVDVLVSWLAHILG